VVQIRRSIVAGLVARAVATAWPLTAWFASTGAAQAQQSGRIARVGWLGWIGGIGASPSTLPLESLRAGLRERGWVDGTNLVIDVRAGDSALARELTAQLVGAKADVIVAQGPMIFGARTVAGATPLVFSINGDPVEANLVGSLAHPGGNITGITALAPDLAGKRLELLKECVPVLQRVALIGNQSHPGVQTELREAEAAAKRLGLAVQFFPVRRVDDFAATFEAIARMPAQAIVAFPDNLINHQAGAIADFAARRRIAAVSGWKEFAQAGNVISYGPELREFYRRAAFLADRLLNGSRAADLPVEQPTAFELVINLKAARAAGIPVPPAVLGRADLILK
jgi:putative ABC transport system substrate-binding protein